MKGERHGELRVNVLNFELEAGGSLYWRFGIGRETGVGVTFAVTVSFILLTFTSKLPLL